MSTACRANRTSSWRRCACAWTALTLVAAALLGCSVGEGSGWVQGALWIDGCDGDESFGTSANELEEFDLGANFFAGDIQEDSTKAVADRRNSLVVRVQNTSNNIEVSDGLLIQLSDLPLAAASFAASQPMDITNSSLCEGTPSCVFSDSVRATLFMFSSCSGVGQSLVGASYLMEDVAESSPLGTEQCLRPVLTPGGMTLAPPCPVLTETDQQALEQLCTGDFDDPRSLDSVRQILGDGACLYLCRIGSARKGQDVSELSGFHVRYGDRVAGLFVTNIQDGRAVQLRTCSRSSGWIAGMFNFEVRRGRAAQSFP